MINNRHELTGLVKNVTPVETITSRNGKQYPKRSIVFDLTPTDMNTGQRSKYENIAELEFVGDFACEKIDGISAGDYAKVTFEVSGFAYTDKQTGEQKYFTKVRPFNVEKVSTEQPQQPQPTPQPQSFAPAEDDTLPF